LTLVQRIVTLHGGRVEARSEGTGKGSEFIVRLPMLEPDDLRPPTAHSGQPDLAAPFVEAHRRTILVVDDNLDSAETLAQLLVIMGNSVHIAHDGPQAIELTATKQPDVIFLDIGLPGMSGYETARRIRNQPSAKRSLMIALTGLGRDDDRRRSLDAGFDHHLVKPLHHEQLLALLTQPPGPHAD
jgi:CheY-like chemotaxis protein